MEQSSQHSIFSGLVARILSRCGFRPAKQNRKILMVTQYLGLGGLERMVLNLATSLKADLQWEPQVFVFDHDKHSDTNEHLGPAFESEGIRVVYFSKRPRFSVRAVLKIVGIVFRDDISVIHTHDLGSLIYGACAKIISLGLVRLVHTQHSFVNIGLVKRHVFYQKFFTFFADEITVVSPDTRESYRKLGAGQREVHLVPNGVRFAENPAGGPWTRALKLKARDAALESLTDQANVSVLKSLFDSHWILYMARVHGRKGQDQAMKLWKEMKPEVRRKTALIFLGLTTDPEQLKKLCALIEVAPDRDRMIYLGPSQSPGLWLRASEVFLSSSEFEGMPMASIEASGSGLSLVLSAIPGHESLLGKSFQYPLDHPEVGAKAVEEVISAIETEGDRFFASTWSASESIRNRYSVLQMATMYSKLYPKKG